VSVCAKADWKVIDGKRDDDAASIPDTKKVINDIARGTKIPFMNQPSKNTF
jgi:hypothetical protein